MFMYLLKTAKDFIYIGKKIRQTYPLTIRNEQNGTQNGDQNDKYEAKS